jgi:MoaD family protein
MEGLKWRERRLRNVMAGTKRRIAVTVRSFATLREVMDPHVLVDLDEGATLRTLLGALAGRYGELHGRIFAEPDTLRNFVNILKNGRNIEFLAGLDTPLDDGDIVALFPPLAGG